MNTSSIKVVVIGGGFAGLTASAILRESGVDVTLVEASDCLGGRVRQIRPFEGCPLVDLGGEFIHGNKTEAFKLATKLGWEYHENISKECPQLQPDKNTIVEETLSFSEYSYVNGHLCRLSENNDVYMRALKCYNEFIGAGIALEAKLTKPDLQRKPYIAKVISHTSSGSIKEDKLNRCSENDYSFEDFLSKSVDMDNDCRSLVDAMYGVSEGNDLDRIGVLAFSKAEDHWQYGRGDYRLRESFNVYLDYAKLKCSSVDIKLDWQAKAINYQNTGLVQVTNQKGDTLEANFVLIAVPLTILKEGDITFCPELSASKCLALQAMKMRSAFKMFCCFERRFWPEDLTVLYSTAKGPFMQIWTVCQYETDGKRRYVLCGFATASLSDLATNSNKDDLKDRFLSQLDNMFSHSDDRPATESFVDYYCYDWRTNPFVRGGYSSVTVGSYMMAETLAESVDGKLFFAGEATNTTARSTIQSAVDSGVRAANEISFCINNIPNH